ncbi:hypothetical protein N9917_01085 [Deltaproteobacteria bacterium]|nr:hypothetical protein [Deltaproteobacteria bacterium]
MLRSTILRIASDLPVGDPTRRELLRMAKNDSYDGNADGKAIYPGKMDHGYDQALSGGHDIMKRVVDNLRIEQGSKPRDPNPRLAGRVADLYLGRKA